MKKSTFLSVLRNGLMIAAGCAIFSLGFDLFLEPNAINVGGLTGLAMVIRKMLGFGTVGLISAALNVPLFLLGFKKLGKGFFFGSLFGMAMITLFLELFLLLPVPACEPLLATIYGGVLSGLGVGVVFLTGASTGGTDILARLLKARFRELKPGKILLAVDLAVVLFTGLVFRDLSRALYSGVTLYISSVALDGVLFGANNSTVAMIISDQYQQIAQAIDTKLERGVTYLDGEGYYTSSRKTVLLCAVAKRQTGLLKQLVSETDPDAFMILQEANQVLGQGFRRYNDSL